MTKKRSWKKKIKYISTVSLVFPLLFKPLKTFFESLKKKKKVDFLNW